ncbi:MAG TPA: hypothetical protein DDW27_12030 [Bacteroidales bacterium]|nr:hypothetical protein [Bacteroidales bacterium]
MPYRRLPNTDAARIRAMKNALKISRDLPPSQMAISARSLVNLQRFIAVFEHNILLHRQTFTFQNNRSGDYSETLRKAKIYLIHFIRVMNLAILRGDLSPETRQFYGLAVNDPKVPSLRTENELIMWGRKIIEGEEKRIRTGGSPVTNPTIAVVKVRFENFIEANNYHKLLIKRIHDHSVKATNLRKEADEIILQIWNEVEQAFADLPEEIRRKECENYGIVYFYRKSEKVKHIIPGNLFPVYHKQAI